MTTATKEALKNPLPTVLSLLDTVLSTRDNVKYGSRKRSAKFKFTSDLIFDHLEGISKNSKDIKRLCLEQNAVKIGLTGSMDNNEPIRKVDGDGEISEGNHYEQQKDGVEHDGHSKQHQPQNKQKRRTNKQQKLHLASSKEKAKNETRMTNEAKKKKDSSPCFSIDNILSKSCKSEFSSSKERTFDFDKAFNGSDRRLPNISLFFQPIEERMKFSSPASSSGFIADSPSLGPTTRCGLSGTASSNVLARNGAFIAPLDDSFPLLRNAGKLEFHQVGLSQAAIKNTGALKLESKENSQLVESKVEDNKDYFEPSSDRKATPAQLNASSSGSNGGTGRGYKCEKCGKIYCRKYVLKIHMRTHTGDKPLKCEICGKSFSDPSNMKKHIKLHETDHVTYPCKFCGRNFVRRRGLLNHLHSMHSRFPFTQTQ